MTSGEEERGCVPVFMEAAVGSLSGDTTIDLEMYSTSSARVSSVVAATKQITLSWRDITYTVELGGGKNFFHLRLHLHLTFASFILYQLLPPPFSI